MKKSTHLQDYLTQIEAFFLLPLWCNIDIPIITRIFQKAEQFYGYGTENQSSVQGSAIHLLHDLVLLNK